MILTVTAHAALDRVLFIPAFVPAGTMRTDRAVDAVGGKGFDASVALQGLGAENVALGFMAGPTGQQLARLLDGYGIHHDLVWVAGDTRVSHVVVETQHRHRESHITATGYAVTPTDIEHLVTRYCAWLASAQGTTLCGSLPPGAPVDLYARLVHLAHAAGVLVLIDCVGEPARCAVAARPTVLKSNRAELATSFGIEAPALVELVAGVQRLRAEYELANVVVTGGSDGMLAVTAGGDYLAATPSQPAVNAAGAGDAVAGVIAWRLASGDKWPEVLRWAAAAGAAATLTERTAECRAEDVQRLYAQVVVQAL